MNFEDWLRLGGRHPNTVKKHLLNLSVLIREIEFIEKERIDSFLLTLIQDNKSTSTINNYISTVRLYAQFQDLDEELKTLKIRKTSYRPKPTMSDTEIEQLINCPCPEESNNACWDLYSLYFKLLAYTGARPMEISALKPSNFLGNGIIRLDKTKTGAPRNIVYPEFLQENINPYMDGEKLIFVTQRGAKFSHASYYHQFKKRLRLIGLKRTNVSLYSLRHSFITNLVNEDINIHKVAKMAGHDIRQTIQYEHLTTKDIKRALTKLPMVKKHLKPRERLRDIAEVVRDYSDGLDININLTESSLLISVQVKSPE